ncbi:MAG: flavodoxin-dependent (E)-4-hydroxy-3-methylbut-2-enyl-diphosphate synthase, partial [Bacteroidota bacterium]
AWKASKPSASGEQKYFPLFMNSGFADAEAKDSSLNFVMVDCFSDATPINDYSFLEAIANDPSVVICLSSKNRNDMQSVRAMLIAFIQQKIKNPVLLMTDSQWVSSDEHLIHYATECGALLLDGMGDGLWLSMNQKAIESFSNPENQLSGRIYAETSVSSPESFLNQTAFGILQATRTRISKTEDISCPSCGRTLFDLQETTAKIRAVTNHLKGVKIAIMGCIVNGPGEMADADFGYVGSGVGKITLYKGKEIVKRNIDSEIAVQELIQLLKDYDAWVEPVTA